MMTLDEIQQHLERYKQPIHKGNPTAQRYVAAVEALQLALIENVLRAELAEHKLATLATLLTPKKIAEIK